jgi:hypothetical protein
MTRLNLADAKSSSTLEVVLADISLQDLPEGLLSYQVFLDLPRSPSRSARIQDYFIGSISLFSLGHLGTEHPGMEHSATLRFDVTRIAAKLITRSRALRLSFVSVLRPGASMPGNTVLEIGEARIETRGASA